MWQYIKRYLCSCIRGVVEQTAGMPLPDSEVSVMNPLHSSVAYDVGRIGAASTSVALAVLARDVPSSLVSTANLAMDVNRLSTDIRRQEHIVAAK